MTSKRASAFAVVILLSVSAFAARAVAGEVEVLPDLVYGHKDGLAMTLDVLKPRSGANGAAKAPLASCLLLLSKLVASPFSRSP